MLRILTNLNLLNRQDFLATAGLIASGYTGTWVSKIAADYIDLPGTAGDSCIGTVWTESNRDGTVGWTPDVSDTGKLTVVFGRFRALTDQFTATPAIGEALKVGTDGKLATATLGGTDRVVGYCTKASHTIEHLGRNHTVIEYVTA
ncbi:MAG TPA: hypothetical protein PKN48_00710 [Bacteroidales bacterium]|nr:hypothetical protein [Bacteroidales bacterium]